MATAMRYTNSTGTNIAWNDTNNSDLIYNRDYNSLATSIAVDSSIDFTEMSENVKKVTKAMEELGTAVKKATDKPAFDVTCIKQPLPDEIIVINFHLDEITLEEAQDMIKEIQKAFPYNEVIGKLDSFELLIGHGYEVLA